MKIAVEIFAPALILWPIDSVKYLTFLFYIIR